MAVAHAQDSDPPIYELEHVDLKGLEIKNLKLFAWENEKGKKYVEVQEFQEMREGRLLPSSKFDISCEVVGGLNLLAGDYFVWTTVDFLVAPVRHGYQQMDNKQLSSRVGWGQVLEMRDLSGTPIYFLRPDETRQIVLRNLDLRPVLAAFPARDPGELWPWLVRVTVHVQDRSGKQLGSVERVLRLSPGARRKSNHYNDPLPSR
jgi:hypothetical protein